MTKSELKSIIMECLEEEGVVTEAFDEDAAIIESCEIMEEACFAMLEAKFTPEELRQRTQAADIAKASGGKISEFETLKAIEAADEKRKQAEKLANIKVEQGKSAKPEIEQKAAESVASKLGKGFKAVGGKVVSVYTGKDGKGKQAAAIAVTASALAASIAAIAMKIRKDKKKEEEKDEK